MYNVKTEKTIKTVVLTSGGFAGGATAIGIATAGVGATAGGAALTSGLAMLGLGSMAVGLGVVATAPIAGAAIAFGIFKLIKKIKK